MKIIKESQQKCLIWSMTRFILIILISIFLDFNLLSDEISNPNKLKIALLPDENAAKIIEDNQGLLELLEKKLNKRIELIVSTDYSTMIEAIRFKRIHVGYFGPLSYTIAKSKANITPFAAREKNGKTHYRSVIIGNSAQNIKDFEDIRGKNFGFGDVASTSSHLIPKFILKKNNLEGKKDYKEVYLGTHDAVAIAIQNGIIQAGGLSEPIFDMLIKNRIIDLKKINIIEYSEYYPQYPWVYIDDLNENLKKQISEIFLNIKDKQVLSKFKADKFSKILDSEFDIIRKLATNLKLYNYEKKD